MIGFISVERCPDSWNTAEANCVTAGKLSPAACKCVNGYLAAHISFEKFRQQQIALVNNPVNDWVAIDDKNKNKSPADFMKESPIEIVRLMGEAMSICIPAGKK